MILAIGTLLVLIAICIIHTLAKFLYWCNKRQNLKGKCLFFHTWGNWKNSELGDVYFNKYDHGTYIIVERKCGVCNKKQSKYTQVL